MFILNFLTFFWKPPFFLTFVFFFFVFPTLWQPWMFINNKILFKCSSTTYIINNLVIENISYLLLSFENNERAVRLTFHRVIDQPHLDYRFVLFEVILNLLFLHLVLKISHKYLLLVRIVNLFNLLFTEIKNIILH